MKLQYSFTILVLTTVLALIGAAEWTQSQKLASEQREAFYENLGDKVSTLQQAIKARVESLRNELAQTASKHSETSKVLASESPFTAIAWLKKNPAGASAKYKAEWAESNTQVFDPSWLKGVNFSQVKDGESLFVRKIDRYGNPFFALVITAVSQVQAPASQLPEQAGSDGADDRVYLFAALSPTVLNSWVDDYVGSSMAAMVFDEAGNVISHSQRQYSSTNLSGDKFVSSSFRSGRSKLTQEFSDLEGEKRVGESLKLAQTNLRLGITLPQAAIAKFKTDRGRSSQRSLMIFLGSILVLAAYFVGGALGKRNPKASNESKRVDDSLMALSPAPASNVVVAEVLSQVAVEEPLTFEDVERKTQINIDQILARSQQIRKRLELDFIETIASAEAEQKLAIENEPSQIEVDNEVKAPNPSESLPKVKVRRPKVSL